MQLTTGVDDTDRYLELDEDFVAASLFPYVAVGSEVMLVINGQGTDRIKVRRGQSGTTAAAHSSGTAVTVPSSTHSHPTLLQVD